MIANEGYFCQIKFISRKAYNQLPSDVRISIKVGAKDEAGHDLYLKEFTTLLVKMSSGIHLSKDLMRTV